jgi:acyl-CoA synthetase (AMP-forming)/AMP-acid ligase II
MIVDRHLVSKNFKCQAPNSDLVFDRDGLVDFVNYWKAIFLEKHGLVRGNKIGIGYALIDIYYFGAVIAAAELGLKLVILDNTLYNKHKVDQFYPFDLLLWQSIVKFSGHEQLKNNSLQVENDSIFDNYTIQSPEKFQDYVSTMCNEHDVLMLCTSSGTTGVPKVINHTHTFIHQISKRNANLLKFKGRVCHVKSLHHGSSLTTYFLPSLLSDECESHHIFVIKTYQDIVDSIKYFQESNINHVQLSYRKELEAFLQQAVDQSATFEDLTIHTLGYIDPDWQQHLKKIGNVKIISVFGSNETSGPILTNTLTADSEDFDPTKFFLCDDFYKISQTKNNQLLVSLPGYENSQVVMEDNFKIQDNVYYHQGRADMFRIGEIEIDANWFLTLCSRLKIHGDLVFDRLTQKIYYADWNNGSPEENFQRLNQELISTYGATISDWKILDHRDYLYGIKVDHQMIREEFRC